MLFRSSTCLLLFNVLPQDRCDTHTLTLTHTPTQDTAEDIVLQLLIDDGDAQRTKRRMLIDREFNNVGIAADKEKCLVNFATRFHDK